MITIELLSLKLNNALWWKRWKVIFKWSGHISCSLSHSALPLKQYRQPSSARRNYVMSLYNIYNEAHLNIDKIGLYLFGQCQFHKQIVMTFDRIGHDTTAQWAIKKQLKISYVTNQKSRNVNEWFHVTTLLWCR